MNSPVEMSVSDLDQWDAGCRKAVMARFGVEDIQRLGTKDLLDAKTIAGHGKDWGRWQTARMICPSASKKLLDIDIAKRIRSYLRSDLSTATTERASAAWVSKDANDSAWAPLIDEGVLAVTRIALIAKLAPSGGRGYDATLRLKPGSISQYIYASWPRLVARAIRRRASAPCAAGGTGDIGLFRCLSEADVVEFNRVKRVRIEIERLDSLVARGLWWDAPPKPVLPKVTKPSSKSAVVSPAPASEPYIPLPDDWLAEIGPRVLWVVEELAPHLLQSIERLPALLEGINWERDVPNVRYEVRKLVGAALDREPWLDGTDRPLMPPFRLANVASSDGGKEWPPRTYERLISLSATLQAAHLFITLLSSAGRISEVGNLTTSCVEVGCDGMSTLKGHTYKLTGNLHGIERQWPAPDILVRCLGQQARLSAAWGALPSSLGDRALPKTNRFGSSLWVSIGPGLAGEGARLEFRQALQNLAKRLLMDPKPGGRPVHPHRFRKTIGRLAGLALWNSPLVLKRLFGHKSIEMTLHYILCDPGVRAEAERVLRELRVMHCAETLEELHKAHAEGRPLPGHGGAGAVRLMEAVRKEEDQLAHSGRVWSEGTAYDLAYLLTAQGQGWRLINEHTICSKAPHEPGLCQKQRFGQPNTAGCKPECSNRIVLARQRRDTELIIQRYISLADKAHEDGQVMVLASVIDHFERELHDFADLKETYRGDLQRLKDLLGAEEN